MFIKKYDYVRTNVIPQFSRLFIELRELTRVSTIIQYISLMAKNRFLRDIIDKIIN